MFSSTRLHAFVCLALGISVYAAPAGAPDATIDARSPDVYDLSGGLGALLLGLSGGESYGGDSDEDAYILKRQLAGLDIGSRLGHNMGIQHAARLGEGALGAGAGSSVEARSPDLYDLSGGLGALLLGLSGGESYGGDSDEDAYILKRQLVQLAGLDIGVLGLGGSTHNGVETRSPDVYDLSGGLGALLLGLSGGEGYSGNSDEDEDAYILKRQLVQLAGITIGSGLGSSTHRGVETRSPDVYDLSGGIGALLLGYSAGYGEGGEDTDTYILKRQLEGLGLGSTTNFGSAANLGSFGGLDVASLLNGNAAATSTDTSASGANVIGAGSGLDTNSILSSFSGKNGAAGGNLASSFGLGNEM
ncbi:hypothetical protein PENSPDRAFT_753743 [Peniophora sp. CONT]|nr:hypothetical protein PENSPDRAFT_753743 [Peniophora sp. CONT]